MNNGTCSGGEETHGRLIALVVISGLVIGGLNVEIAGYGGASAIRDGPIVSTPASLGVLSSASVPPHSVDTRAPAVASRAVDLALALSNLPASTRDAPWVQALLHPGATLRPVTSLPNLNLLEHPVTSVADAVAPGYVAQPAPLGIGDFGLGATPYALNTTHILGQVTFNSEPNETDPGSTGVIEPATNGLHNGYVGSTNEFGIQLNTVVQNITFPGSDQGFLWTQNVVDWNDSGIHFVSDTFNFSAGSGFYIPPGTIVSGCNNGTAGVDEILHVYGGVFQCVGGTIPVTAASYPVTLQLFNNATVNVHGQDVVNYSYFIHMNGTGKNYAGTYNSVVLNNPAAPSPPAVKPEFSINGFHPAPAGLLRDAEIDLVGDIGGDNTVFRALNATVHLEYSNLSVGGWGNAPSAYNFGGDTGETSAGIADYWTPGHTLVMHQGPAMLYGLWNAEPSVSVASGSIHLAGSIGPNYGFVFVSNTRPRNCLDCAQDNFSWLPTNAKGQFNTYLPPLGSAFAPTQYYVQAFAPKAVESNGTPVTGTDTNYVLSLPPAHGNITAPLYMFSNAQVADLALNVSAQVAPPYSFSNLAVHSNISFNHLNDYDYPSFEIFVAQGITVPLTVSNVRQGSSAPWDNYYFGDGPGGPGGLLYPEPPVFGPLPNYTSQINIYFSSGATVDHERLTGLASQGGELVLWDDSAPVVTNTTSRLGSQGVWVGDSTNATVQNTSARIGLAIGVQDIGSRGTVVEGLSGLGGIGVEAYSATDSFYTDINVVAGEGILAGAEFGLGSGTAAAYYDLPGTSGLTVTKLDAGLFSLGANISVSTHTTIEEISSVDSIAALLLDSDSATVVSGVRCTSDLFFCILSYTDPATISRVSTNGGGGVVLLDSSGTHLTDSVFLDSLGFGLILFDSSGTHVTDSVFFNSTSDAVLIQGGTNNVVYDNSLILNNGSTNVYNPHTLQAYSTAGNYFNSSAKVGNYWADWHTGSHGVLSPYKISNGVSDNYPLSTGTPGTAVVTFTETGLPVKELAKKGWTTVVDGMTNHSTTTTSAFTLVNGTYVDLVMGPSGYLASGHAGTVPDGSVVLAGATNVPVTMTKGKTVSLTFGQKGITGSWCVSLEGLQECATGKSQKFADLTPGSYNYSVVAPNHNVTLTMGKTSEPLSGPIDLTKNTKLTLTYLYTYTVTFSQMSLTWGTWSVTIKGHTESAGFASNITFTLANGTYKYKVGKETGLTSAGTPPSPITVSGKALDVSVKFTAKP